MPVRSGGAPAGAARLGWVVFGTIRLFDFNWDLGYRVRTQDHENSQQEGTSMASEKNGSRSDSGWEHRVLCSDESCIGVIGPDGRCKECGLAYRGVLPWQVDDEPAAEPAEAEADAPETALADAADERAEDHQDKGGISDDEWERRVLCSDESCIGVIGPDGRCKECGKPYQED
jgi:hypothetical protein